MPCVCVAHAVLLLLLLLLLLPGLLRAVLAARAGNHDRDTEAAEAAEGCDEVQAYRSPVTLRFAASSPRPRRHGFHVSGAWLRGSREEQERGFKVEDTDRRPERATVVSTARDSSARMLFEMGAPT